MRDIMISTQSSYGFRRDSIVSSEMIEDGQEERIKDMLYEMVMETYLRSKREDERRRENTPRYRALPDDRFAMSTNPCAEIPIGEVSTTSNSMSHEEFKKNIYSLFGNKEDKKAEDEYFEGSE